MKICFVTESLNEKHGYGRVSLDLINGLTKKGISGPICIHQDSPIPPNLNERICGKLINHPLSPLIDPIKLHHDWRVINKASKDCDGIFFLTESFLATTFFNYKKPYYVTAYGTWAIKPLKSNVITRNVFLRGYKNANNILTISNETKKRLLSEYHFNNIQTIYLGIDRRKWKLKNTRSNKKEINILTVAAINPSKGLHIALKAIIKLKNKFNINYTIAGGKTNVSYQESLYNIAHENDFTGFKILNSISDDDLKRVYTESDIFILPSIEMDGDYEGFGLILLEAFAAKLPIIASNSGAIPEIITDKYNGILVPEGNSDAITKGIDSVLRSKTLRQSIINNGEGTLEKFSSSSMIENYYKVLKHSL